MNYVLLVVLFFLMIYIDRRRGIKLFLSIFFNFLVLFIIFYLIVIGFNPIITSLIGCLIFSYIILYFVNGENVKTKASMKSIIVVLLILLAGIYLITYFSLIAGFGEEATEEIYMFSTDVNVDFTNITISLILVSLIGVIIDASVAISSALYEVYDNNKHLSFNELFKSGMNIGKDILCTSVNTLLFAFLGDFMTLLIWFYSNKYSFLEIINSKTFVSEFIKILFSATGCVMVIPVTAYITSKNIVKNLKDKK